MKKSMAAMILASAAIAAATIILTMVREVLPTAFPFALGLFVVALVHMAMHI